MRSKISARRIWGLKARVKKLKQANLPIEERRLILFRQGLERYVRKNRITGELMENILGLGNKRGAARINAASVLGSSNSGKTLLPLISALRDKNPNVKLAAASSLEKFRNSRIAGTALLKALKDRHDDVRLNAAASLANIKDKRAVKPLIELLLNDGSSGVRMYAANALGKLGEDEAVKPLLAAIVKEKNREVASFAGGAIGNIAFSKAAADKTLNKEHFFRALDVFRGLGGSKPDILLLAVANGKITMRGTDKEIGNYLARIRRQAERLSAENMIKYLGL